MARGYLVFLEQRGISDLGQTDGGSVLAFLESLLDRWAKSSLFWVVSNFRPFPEVHRPRLRWSLR